MSERNSTGRITHEILEQAFDAIRNAPPPAPRHDCRFDGHVLIFNPWGFAACTYCGASPGAARMLTAILYGLIAAFVAGDSVAHFTHYRYGPTVSWTILWLEKRWPIFHLIVGVLLLVLGLHLEGAF